MVVLPPGSAAKASEVASNVMSAGSSTSTDTSPGSPVAWTANVAYPGPTRVASRERTGSPGTTKLHSTVREPP
ncbi:hypothetical protein ABE437_13285 [Isoptericola cucumis]|uniref:hypothetical protein n=1 Tax=Isoptericola cucumis TaxID=1776856 RepID=UPI00320A83F8